MNGQSDPQLLRAYTESRSEAAFAELVRRHVDFVYSAARRMVCDVHLAEDVTQAVFVALARNASQLVDRSVLSGWLHRTAQNIAAQTVRTIERRRAREKNAMAMNQLLSPESDAAWEQIAPHLDAALGELNETDRDALLLRYFERKSASEMAEILGTSDEAAQKRVNRALERLRQLFTKRGVTVGASGLVLVISAHAVQAAPVGLAITVSTAAALTATATTVTATALTIAHKAIAMTALQKSLITAAVIVASVGTPALIQHRSQVKLRRENVALRQQIQDLSGLTSENERLSRLVGNANSGLSSTQMSDLLRLRGEVGLLRQQTNELGKLREENRRLQAAQDKTVQKRAVPGLQDTTSQTDFPRESWVFAGYTNPESTLLSLASAALAGDLETFLNCLTPDFQAEQRQKWQSNGNSEAQMRDNLVSEFGRTETIRILNKENISENEIILSLLIDNGGGNSETPKMRVQRIGEEWKMAGPYHPQAQSRAHIEVERPAESP